MPDTTSDDLSDEKRPAAVKDGEVQLPPGWKYKPIKIGPFTIPWYASPTNPTPHCLRCVLHVPWHVQRLERHGRWRAG